MRFSHHLPISTQGQNMAGLMTMSPPSPLQTFSFEFCNVFAKYFCFWYIILTGVWIFRVGYLLDQISNAERVSLSRSILQDATFRRLICIKIIQNIMSYTNCYRIEPVCEHLMNIILWLILMFHWKFAAKPLLNQLILTWKCRTFRFDPCRTQIPHHEDCVICLEPFSESQIITALPCSHCFHQKCFLNCLNSLNSCPLCRIPL